MRCLVSFAGFVALMAVVRAAAFAYNDRKFAPATGTYVKAD